MVEPFPHEILKPKHCICIYTRSRQLLSYMYFTPTVYKSLHGEKCSRKSTVGHMHPLNEAYSVVLESWHVTLSVVP